MPTTATISNTTLTQLPHDVKKEIFQYLSRQDQIHLTSTGSKILFNDRSHLFTSRIWGRLPLTTETIAHIFPANGEMTPSLALIHSLSFSSAIDINLLNSTLTERKSLFQALKSLRLSLVGAAELTLITNMPDLSLEQLTIRNYTSPFLPIIRLNHLSTLNLYLDGFSVKLNDFIQLELPSNLGTTCPNLQTLRLSSRRLTQLQGAFSILPELTTLEIKAYFLNNNIPTQEDFYKNFPKLNRLKIELAEDTLLPKSIALLPQLTQLKTRNTFHEQETLDHTNPFFPALQKVSLDPKVLTSLSMFGPLTRVRQLKFSSFMGKTLPDDFSANLPNLQKLTFDSLEASDLPESLANLQSLTELSIVSGLISSIPGEDADAPFPRLQKLTLRELENFYSLPHIPTLTELTITGDRLKYLPDDFSENVPNLQKLTFDLYKLKSLPEDFTDLQKLTELNIKSYKFKEFPQGFGTTFTELKKLKLQLNSLKKLPKSLTGLTQLVDLDIDTSVLITFPSIFRTAFPKMQRFRFNCEQVVIHPSQCEEYENEDMDESVEERVEEEDSE